MLTYNGYPVVFELSMVTEPGEGWKGSRQLAVCKTVEELTAAINDHMDEVPDFWLLEVQLQDDLDHPDNQYLHEHCDGCYQCGDTSDKD